MGTEVSEDTLRIAGFESIVVTGAAGFIGSRLCEVLLDLGCSVTGIDCFTDYYERSIKERNLDRCRESARFELVEVDLAGGRLDDCVVGADAVLHLAAMPGLVRSWTDLAAYSRCNVVATGRLLDAVVGHAPEARLIQVSTSSVYGLDATGDESSELRPASPYGITKLAAEHLVHAYRAQHELDAVILRYFSVYGPRQRPDMAYNIFCRRLAEDAEISLYGDGNAVRSNTFVDDCVRGTIQALLGATSGETYNIGGGVAITVNEAIELLAEVAGVRPRIRRLPPRQGDQRVTIANFAKATKDFGYEPAVAPAEGLARQWAWHAATHG